MLKNRWDKFRKKYKKNNKNHWEIQEKLKNNSMSKCTKKIHLKKWIKSSHSRLPILIQRQNKI